MMMMIIFKLLIMRNMKRKIILSRKLFLKKLEKKRNFYINVLLNSIIEVFIKN